MMTNLKKSVFCFAGAAPASVIAGEYGNFQSSTMRAAATKEQHGNAAEFMPSLETKDAGCNATGKLPDSACTPGAVQGITVEEICTTDTSTRRDVTEATKKHVFAEYGISTPQPTGA